MSKVYLSTAEESSQTNHHSNGESRDPSTLNGPVPPPTTRYTREDLDGEDITIEFPDDPDLSLEDIVNAVTLTDDNTLLLDSEPSQTQDDDTTTSNTEPPDDPDDEQSFYWPLDRELTDLEESVFLNYFVPTWPPTIAQPPAFHIIHSLGMWREEVAPLVPAVAKILDEIDIDDSESSAPYDDIDSIRAILKTIKRAFSDFSTLHKIAWDVLVHDTQKRQELS